MRKKSEIKADLISSLELFGDHFFASAGFKRRKNSLEYTRVVGGGCQVLVFAVTYNPNYHANSELHIYPNMRVELEVLTEAVMRLVKGDESLVANVPEIIFNQPIEFAAPKENRFLWYGSGLKGIGDQVIGIMEFIREWVLPMFEEISSPRGLIEVYQKADGRLIGLPRLYLYIAASYVLEGEAERGLMVLRDNFKTKGLKRRYLNAFIALGDDVF